MRIVAGSRKTDKKFRRSGLIRKSNYFIHIIFAWILHLVKKPQKEFGKYWLFGLADDIYANNGKALYEYMKKEHPEIKLFWVCDKESQAALSQNIDKDSLIVRASIDNYWLAMDAQVAVYGFSDRDVAPGFYRVMKNHHSLVVNVSHGFDGLKGMPYDYYTPLAADLICAASSYEMDMKIRYCGADISKVRLTGFARYDGWEIAETHNNPIRKILIMPTWRDWYEEDGLEWNKTAMYSAYMSMLTELNILAEEYHFILQCKFHPRMSMFYKNAKWDELKQIQQMDDCNSMQQLLKEADLVITDYSSIFWDVLYMAKPVFLYWFDEDDYLKKRGLLVNHSFYPYVFNNGEDLVNSIRDYLKNRKSIKDYSSRYFNWKDHNNCLRIYKEIQKCLEDQMLEN